MYVKEEVGDTGDSECVCVCVCVCACVCFLFPAVCVGSH